MADLESLTKEINVRFEKAEHYRSVAREKSKDDNKRARDHRIAAGMLLIEARQYVKDGEWYAWCEANIRRSVRDIRKVMRIAGHVDPEAAAAEEREVNVKHQRASRGGLTKNVSPVNHPLEELIIEFMALSPVHQSEFLRRIGAIRYQPHAA